MYVYSQLTLHNLLPVVVGRHCLCHTCIVDVNPNSTQIRTITKMTQKQQNNNRRNVNINEHVTDLEEKIGELLLC